MAWVIAMGLALIVAGTVIDLGRLPRSTWELLGAALLLGVAGYAWQGRPNLPGSPRSIQEKRVPFDEKLTERRRSMEDRFGKSAQWMILSDGLARQGKTREAANVLVSALREYPDDANLWTGLGNALVAHGGGILSPSADFAFRRAIALQPAAPGAAYFYGLSLIRSGQLDAGRDIWARLAARLPKESDLRGELETDVAGIDRLLVADRPSTPGSSLP
jgi:cytochrome c-type biogenesis protein CcmH